jgi:hypothetical protein
VRQNAGAAPELVHGTDEVFEIVVAAGFAQEAVGAKIVGTQDVFWIVRAAENDDNYGSPARMSADALQYFEPIDRWHFQVEENELGQWVDGVAGKAAGRLDALDSHPATFDCLDPPGWDSHFCDMLEEKQIAVIIVDDQYVEK